MNPTKVRDIRHAIGSFAIDTAPLFTIWNDGSDISGTATTAATITVTGGTTPVAITLKINGAVDSRIGSSGVINLLSATYNTAGEVYDHVNSVDGWHMRLEGILRAGVLSDGTRGCVIAQAEISCLKTPITILRDTDIASKSAGWEHAVVISARTAPVAAARRGKLGAMEYEHGFRAVIEKAVFTSTYASGTSTIKIYQVKGSTETLLHSQAGGATTAAGTWTPGAPVVADPGYHIVALLSNSADMSAVTCDVTGYCVKGAEISL